MKMDNGDAGSTDQMLLVSRRLYTQEEFDRQYSAETEPTRTLRNRVEDSCKCTRKTPWKILTTYLPVVKFIRKYKVREYLLGDFLAGLTVSFMHLPQAMGFGILASLRPEHGLYATFFPVLVYLIFGTSPHISIGTNAVMALLTQTVVEREEEAFVANFHGSTGNVSIDNSSSPFGPSSAELLVIKVNAAAACSLLAGIFLVGMGLLKFGFLTTYMSESFIGGFTTAAAFHIATSQVPKIFGIKVKSFSGAGKIILTYVDLFRKIEHTVAAEVIIAVISAAALLFVKICVNERYASKMKMPVPIDLIVVIIGTFISHFAKFETNFSVHIVGPIPSSFAKPFVPNLDGVSNYISDAFVMAILSLAMSISMAKLTAKKHGILINDNQELVAYGSSNLISGFFSCFPCATAPPRTMILSSLGSKTPLNGIPTATFMLLVILVIGQLFVSLPLSVLAAMIIVSMKDLLMQYRNLPMIWKVNKYDFIIWVTTNSVGILVDLNYGLIAGIGVSILLVVVQAQLTSGSVMVRPKTEDILVERKRCKSLKNSDGVKVFKFKTGLYYATKDRFKSQLYSKVLDPQLYKKEQQKKQKNASIAEPISDVAIAEPNGQKYTIENEIKPEKLETKGLNSDGEVSKITVIILDCSMMNYMDMGGKNMLLQVIKEYSEIGVDIRLAGMPEQARAILEAAEFYKNFGKEKLFFDVVDAFDSLDREDKAIDNSSV